MPEIDSESRYRKLYHKDIKKRNGNKDLLGVDLCNHIGIVD
jgi:hypothetical protein